MDFLSSLNKSLQGNWTSANLSRYLLSQNCNSYSSSYTVSSNTINNPIPVDSHHRIDEILQKLKMQFVTYDNKVKLRVLISFLNLPSSFINEHSLSIKKLLEEATDEQRYDSWVLAIASIVQKRLFVDDSISSENVLSKKFQQVWEAISENISKGILDEEDIYYILPLETIYLDKNILEKRQQNKESYNHHFTTINELVPNFLEVEKKKAEKILQSNINLNKRTFGLVQQIRNNNSSQFNEAKRVVGSGGSGRLLGSLSSAFGVKRNDFHSSLKSTKIGIEQVKQLQGQHSSRKAVSQVLNNQSTSTSTINDTSVTTNQISIVEKEENNLPKNEVPTIVPSSAPTPVPTSSQVPTSTSTSTITNSSILVGPDLDILFSQSTELSDESKHLIRMFFSSEWSSYFPPGSPDKEFILQKVEKEVDGILKIEYIGLRLKTEPKRNWQKYKISRKKE